MELKMTSSRKPDRRESTIQENLDQHETHQEPPKSVLVEPEVAELACRYIELVHFLSELDENLNTAEYPLEICLDALVAVKRFVDSYPVVAQKGITRPLGMLATSVLDLTLGATPELLKPNKNIIGRPKAVSSTVTLQATGAACAEILIWQGLTVENACKYVLKALEKEKQLKPPGAKPFTWRTVKRWRDEMGGRNPSKSEEIYRGLQSELKKALGANPTIKETEDAVANCIEGLKTTGATGHRVKSKNLKKGRD